MPLAVCRASGVTFKLGVAAATTDTKTKRAENGVVKRIAKV
jgi:hypothetical protein